MTSRALCFSATGPDTLPMQEHARLQYLSQINIPQVLYAYGA